MKTAHFPTRLLFVMFILLLNGFQSIRAANEPTVPATNLNLITSLCNEMDVSWTNGDGAQHLVVISTAPIAFFPQDAIGYSASTTFGLGSDIGGGTYVVSNSNATSVNITGLTGGVTYYVAVFEFNGNGGGADYLITGYPTASATAIGVTVAVNAASSVICQGDSTLLFANGDVIGYTWNPTTSLVNYTDSIVSVFPTTTTTYTVTGYGSNGCTATAAVQITVNPLPLVSLGAFNDACANGGPVTLTGGSPAGGAYSGSFVSGGTFFPSLSGVGTFAIRYSITSPTGCTNSATSFLTVTAPPTVTLAAFNPICANAAPLLLTGGSPAGGTYGGTGVGGGYFNPLLTGPGNKTITYTYFAANGCSNTATNTILVLALPQVTLSPFPNVCPESNTFTLIGGSPVGGTYSGPGVTSGTFNPSITGSGTFTIDYTYTDGNGCTNTAVSPLTVLTPPVVNFTAPSPKCSNGAPFTLTSGTPAGGLYSGSFVNGSQFNPTASGVGAFPVVYFYTDANGCENSDTATVVVNAAPVVTLTTQSSICINAAAFPLTGGSPAGGNYSGTGVSSGTFNPSTAGIGPEPVYYSFTDANGCSSSDTSIITVNPLPVVTLQPFAARCVNTGPLPLSGGQPAGGTYTGQGVGGSTFYAAIAGVGTHAITYAYTDINGCSASDVETIIVNPAPSVSLGPDTTICAGSFLLLNAANTGSVFSWSTGATTQSITVDTSGRGLGTFAFRVTVTSQVGCFNRDTINVTFDICSGVNDLVSNTSQLRVYPNPIHSSCVIVTPENAQLQLMDNQGRIVLQRELLSGENILYPDLPAGIYIARIINDREVSSFRLVKE